MATAGCMDRRTFLGAGLLGALMLASCGSRQPESMPYSLALVCTIVDDEYWQRCIEGVHAADQELGCTTQVYGPTSSEDFSTATATYLERAIASQPDGILAYAGLEALEPLIDQAVEQGIPVVAVDADAPHTARVAFVGPDSYRSGYTCAQALLDHTRGTAKLAALVSSFSATKEAEKLAALRDAMTEYDVDLVAELECGGTAQSAYEVARGLFENHPEVTALFTTSSFIGAGAARAKQELGRDDVTLVAYDDVDENLAYLRSGVIDALAVQDPYAMGREAVGVLCEYLQRGELPQEFYDTGVTMVTQENVDTYRED